MPNSLRTPSAYRVVPLAILVLAIAALAPLPPAAGSASTVTGWVVRCGFVRHLKDDPIVYPGQPGKSHLHAFFGNTTTNASSTYSSLQKGATSCELSEDKAAYWIPAVYSGTTLVSPNSGAFYYRNRIFPPSAVRSFPPGLKMIAGNSSASGPQSTRVVYWDCDGGGSDQNLDHPVNCGTGVVSANILFPECWDGVHTDSSSHKSHMAYAVDPDGDGRATCPTTHAVPVPRLIYSLTFPIHDGTKLKLSSGPYYTMHADFINSWVQSKLDSLVTQCIKAQIDCGTLRLDGS
jgi:uncharacterized protein DUF1996